MDLDRAQVPGLLALAELRAQALGGLFSWGILRGLKSYVGLCEAAHCHRVEILCSMRR